MGVDGSTSWICTGRPAPCATAQARLEIRTDAPGTGSCESRLSRERPHLVKTRTSPRRPSSARNDLLGATPTVEGCGVDPVDAQVERLSNRRIDAASSCGPHQTGQSRPEPIGASRLRPRSAPDRWCRAAASPHGRCYAPSAGSRGTRRRMSWPQKRATTDPIARNGPNGMPILRAFEPCRASR